jgi:hypothetical protein
LPSPEGFLDRSEIGNVKCRACENRHALLLELDFLRRTGFAHFFDLDTEPPERIHPQRIVQAVNREADRVIREPIKSFSHFQDIKQLSRAKAGTRFSGII